MPVDERPERLAIIEDLLSRGDNRSLVYAALELRQLIEFVVYRKLSAYAKYVPESVSATWQPPQAMRALVRLEPEADKDFTLKISFDADPDAEGAATWHDLGEHLALGAGWLTKNYNRLGSYIHFPHGKIQGHDYDAMRRHVTEVFDELQRVSAANILSCTMGERVSFSCQECGHIVFTNAGVLQEDARVVCFNSDCGARYVASQHNGEWRFLKETVDVPCPGCGSMLYLPVHRLEVNSVFICRDCDARMRIGLALGVPPEGDPGGAS